jgi:hypothetical protein
MLSDVLVGRLYEHIAQGVNRMSKLHQLLLLHLTLLCQEDEETKDYRFVPLVL